MRNRSYLAPAAIWLALLVSACGGGSSSSSPEAAADTTAESTQDDVLNLQEEADAANSELEAAQRFQSSNYYSSRLIKVAVQGSGRVTGDRGGIDCTPSGGPKCSASFSSLTYVRLTAAPAAGATFTGWSGSCRGTNLVCRVSNSRSRDVKANFTQAPVAVTSYSLNVSVSGTGSVTSNPGGINCGSSGSACSSAFASGTAVALTAQAPSGYTFQGWSGACSGTGSTCQVSMSQARSVGASFAAVAPSNYTLSVAVSGTGNVKSAPSGIDCGNAATNCSSSFGANSNVTLTAAVPSGQLFNGWGGSCSGTSSSCTVSMSAARSVQANFVTAPTSNTGETGSTSGACSTIYSSGLTFKTGFANDPIPSIAKPVKGVAFAEPTFKTCMVRVTDHAVEPPVGFARNDYSRRQAFNANGTRLIVYSYDGFWHLYDAKTFQHIARLNGLAGDAEPQWHPADANTLYYLPQNGVGMKLHKLDVSKNTSVVAADFSARLKAIWPTATAAWTHSYGSPSADGRYYAFGVADSNWRGLGIFTYDLATDTILGTYSLPANAPQVLPTMSPSGKYVVVTWSKDNTSKVDRFTPDFKNQLRVSENMEHADVALDVNGDDIYVAIDYQANGGPVYMVNLRTGERTSLFSTYVNGTATAFHVSGKAFGKPGWALVSTYGDYGGSQQWLHKKIFAVQLTANPKIYQLAHTRAYTDGYWTEPHASVSRDFTKILFTSNWGVATSLDVDAYMIELPVDALK